MSQIKDINKIDGEIAILNIQKRLLESKNWDDKTHLTEQYEMHRNNFYNVVRYLCNSLGIFNVGEMNEDGFFLIKKQSGEERNFDIGLDYNGERGKDKLISVVEFNKETDSRSLLHYSPTKGIGFAYSANLLPKNVQLGKNDFFGKTIENTIKNIESATEGIKFDTNVDRFEKAPHGLKRFYIFTKDFVPKEKQGDVISIISTLDGLVQGLHKPSCHYVYGPNFIHEK